MRYNTIYPKRSLMKNNNRVQGSRKIQAEFERRDEGYLEENSKERWASVEGERIKNQPFKITKHLIDPKNIIFNKIGFIKNRKLIDGRVQRFF
jgi:hypothetical protein